MIQNNILDRILQEPFRCKLDDQTLLQTSGTDARRLEGLDHVQHMLYAIKRNLETFRHTCNIHCQIAVVIHRFDQISANLELTAL